MPCKPSPRAQSQHALCRFVARRVSQLAGEPMAADTEIAAVHPEVITPPSSPLNAPMPCTRKVPALRREKSCCTSIGA